MPNAKHDNKKNAPRYSRYLPWYWTNINGHITKTHVRVLFSNFFWHIKRGCVQTRKWSWGFCKLWRYKSHAICLKHGKQGPAFNGEWSYWYCRTCADEWKNKRR